MVTLDQLQVLSTLRKAGSFDAAARQLYRAQSAVSYAIKSLEQGLGLQLLDRSGYRARLTPAGEAILKKAEAVLDEARALEYLAQELREGAEPQLNLLVNGILVGRAGRDLVPMLADLVPKRFPTQVNLRVELLEGMVEAVQDIRPELILSPLGLFTIPPEYEHDVVGNLTMLSVVAASHPLARIPPPVPLTEVRKHIHLVIRSRSEEARMPVDPGEIGAETIWNFPDFLTRLEGLRAGLGFAWMPSHLVENDLRRGRLVPLLMDRDSMNVREVALIYRQRPPLGPTGRFLLDEFRSHKQFLPPLPDDIRRMYTRVAS
ncbi:MAG: LysR family transcriptional regulator [Candidatus Lambdaproteobacteria bacterium]|nr:LysR family transcriptional regulator [Candidatus Lambdaproteobacteria bacterium]